MIGIQLNSGLLADGLAATLIAGLIGALGRAIRRSVRRQECARLRDQLVDAARTGELDVADWRVFGLIDWFDQVAATGRAVTPGRHTSGRLDPAESLAHSLVTTLVPLGPLALVNPDWPEPPPVDAGSQLRAAAVEYRERTQRRLRYRPRSLPLRRPRRVPSPRPRVHVTGCPKPDNALVPVQVSTSLVEEIFAVAGSSS